MSKSTRRPIVRNALSREGLVFVVILGFVAVCAVLRNVNMLMFVSGIMFAPLLLCWRLSRHAVRHIVVERVMPNRTHAGQPASIQWKATNSSPVSAFNIQIADMIRQTLSRHGGPGDSGKRRELISRGTVQFEKIAGNDAAYSSYRVLFAERGLYRMGPAIVSCQFPLPLVKCWFRTRQLSEVHVAPRLTKLASKWEQLVFSLATGSESQSRHPGPQDEEFFAIRKWRSGDNMRKIHWRSTAKYGQPMVRQYDSWTDQDLAIILDLYVDANSIDYGVDEAARECETMLSFAATLVSRWADAKAGRLILAIAGDDSAVCSSRDQIDFMNAVMRNLAVARTTAQPQIARAAIDTFNMISGGSPVLVLSSRQRPVRLDIQSACESRIRWIRCDGPEFKSMLVADVSDRRSENELKLNRTAGRN